MTSKLISLSLLTLAWSIFATSGCKVRKSSKDHQNSNKEVASPARQESQNNANAVNEVGRNANNVPNHGVRGIILQEEELESRIKTNVRIVPGAPNNLVILGGGHQGVKSGRILSDLINPRSRKVTSPRIFGFDGKLWVPIGQLIGVGSLASQLAERFATDGRFSNQSLYLFEDFHAITPPTAQNSDSLIRSASKIQRNLRTALGALPTNDYDIWQPIWIYESSEKDQEVVDKHLRRTWKNLDLGITIPNPLTVWPTSYQNVIISVAPEIAATPPKEVQYAENFFSREDLVIPDAPSSGWPANNAAASASLRLAERLLAVAAHKRLGLVQEANEAILTPKVGSDNKVLVIFGQSNADGLPDVKDFSEEMQHHKFTRTVRWYPEYGWVPLSDKRVLNYGYGPEYPYAYAFELDPQRLNQRLYIIKSAVGGTALALGSSWDPQANRLFTQLMRDHYLPAIRSFRSNFAIEGILWLQGESDADAQEKADAYYPALKSLFFNLHSQGFYDNRTIIGRIRTRDSSAFVPAVQQAQVRFADELKGAIWLDTDNLPLRDHVHFDGSAHTEIAKRMAKILANFPDAD